MARGGYRPGSGPQKGAKYRPRVPKAEGEQKKQQPKQRKEKGIPVDIENEAKAKRLTPLQYMLDVMNDKTEKDTARKDRMAVAAAPFVHPRISEGKGKKEEKDDKAKKAGAGKFSAGPPPLKLVQNK